MQKKRWRNVVSLSHVDPDLEQWLKEEAERRKELALPGRYFYELVNIVLEGFKERIQDRDHDYYLKDGRGPYYFIAECLDVLGVPPESRNEDWGHWENLPDEYRSQIKRRDVSGSAKQGHNGKHIYWLKDGRGPFETTHLALDALGVPQSERGKYWNRWDRLPKGYQDLIGRYPRRVFVYDNREFPDPNPRMTPDEVREYMQGYYPELAQAVFREVTRGNEILYIFAKRFGTKGCIDFIGPSDSDVNQYLTSGESVRTLDPVIP